MQADVEYNTSKCGEVSVEVEAAHGKIAFWRKMMPEVGRKMMPKEGKVRGEVSVEVEAAHGKIAFWRKMMP